MTHGDDEIRFGLLLAIGLVISCMIPCTPADGQRVDPARIHAAACIGELGWRAPDDACAAIVEVHVRRAAARGLRPETVARAYSAALRRPPRGRTWVPQLVEPGRPAAWPRGASWRRHTPLYARALVVARETLAGERDVACEGAVHYGGAMDAAPPGHVEACRWDVGRGEQIFYRRGER